MDHHLRRHAHANSANSNGHPSSTPEFRGSPNAPRSLARKKSAQAKGTKGSQGVDLNALQLKRKLAEALPWDVISGAATPALSHSNSTSICTSPASSRENSLHGTGSLHGSNGLRSLDSSTHTLHGSYGVRSLDSSMHTWEQRSTDSSWHGRPSRETSQHGEDFGSDDGAKRVRKDRDTLSKTLNAAGQQAVELTMRYLAHKLVSGAGPHQVHDIMYATWQQSEALRRQAGGYNKVTSQYLTAKILRGLLVKQQLDPNGWPEVHVTVQDPHTHIFCQYLTQTFVNHLSPSIETAPEASVLPPVLLPLLTLVDKCDSDGWPKRRDASGIAAGFVGALEAFVQQHQHMRAEGAADHRARAPSVGQTTMSSTLSDADTPPLSSGSGSVVTIHSGILHTSRAFQNLMIMSPSPSMDVPRDALPADMMGGSGVVIEDQSAQWLTGMGNDPLGAPGMYNKDMNAPLDQKGFSGDVFPGGHAGMGSYMRNCERVFNNDADAELWGVLAEESST